MRVINKVDRVCDNYVISSEIDLRRVSLCGGHWCYTLKNGHSIKLDNSQQLGSGNYGDVRKFYKDYQGIRYAISVKTLRDPHDPEINNIRRQIAPLIHCNIVDARVMYAHGSNQIIMENYLTTSIQYNSPFHLRHHPKL